MRPGTFICTSGRASAGALDEEQPSVNPTNEARQQQRDDRVAIVRAWLRDDPNETEAEQVAKFQALGHRSDETFRPAVPRNCSRRALWVTKPKACERLARKDP